MTILPRPNVGLDPRVRSEPVQVSAQMAPCVYLFNPFAEAYISHGSAFTPVKQQALLAADLANIPQFLGAPEDIILVPKLPSAAFLNTLRRVGFPIPEFVHIPDGHISSHHALCRRKLHDLRPWGWSPDSVAIMRPLFGRLESGRTEADCFNADIAQLYSKTWSAEFLSDILRQRCGDYPGAVEAGTEGRVAASESQWLCSDREVGVVAGNLEEALAAVAAFRNQGQDKIIVKEAFGQAGRNAIRLWEPRISTPQQQWLARCLEDGRKVVVEPWLDRVLDFSIQLDSCRDGLEVLGLTGLVTDRRGQFIANGASPDHKQCLPRQVAHALSADQRIELQVENLYQHIFRALSFELSKVRYIGPFSIDAFVYRHADGSHRLKPIVEINPRYTMGRLTLELMKHVEAGSHGLFRLVNLAQIRGLGFADLRRYADHWTTHHPLEGEPASAKIRQGGLCLNDPQSGSAWIATFEISPDPVFPGFQGRTLLHQP